MAVSGSIHRSSRGISHPANLHQWQQNFTGFCLDFILEIRWQHLRPATVPYHHRQLLASRRLSILSSCGETFRSQEKRKSWVEFNSSALDSRVQRSLRMNPDNSSQSCQNSSEYQETVCIFFHCCNNSRQCQFLFQQALFICFASVFHMHKNYFQVLENVQPGR